MKTTKKLLFVLAIPALLLSSCRATTDDDGIDPTKTNISVYSFNGGVGNEWLEKAISDFQELHANDVYESGTTGVKITWWGNTDSNGSVSTMKTAGDAIYFTEKGQTPYVLANQDLVYDLTDVLQSKASESEAKTIEQKIDSGLLTSLKGQDGKYYALPHYEWYPGLTYDVTIFENGGIEPFYFAAPEETEVVNYTAQKTVGGKTYNFGSGRFVSTLAGKRSCGNDGLYGTEDDGLPSSVQEFLVLCAYLSSKGVAPLAVTANHRDYSAYLLQGFLTSLLGNEGIQNFYDFDGQINVLERDSSGNVQYTGEELFCVGSGIQAPKYQEVTVTEQTGYLTRETYERYYLAGLMKMFLQCDFFSDKSVNSGVDNKQTQKGFINGTAGYKSAMLIEGNYWYNESKAEGYFDAYKRQHREDRNIGWMSLPSKLTGSVEEDMSGTGYKTPLLDTGYSYCIVNKALMNKKSEGFRRAVLEFVKFLYTEAQLQQFTKITGTCKAGLDYSFNSNDVFSSLSNFQKQVLTLKANNGVVYTKVTNDTFRQHQDEFRFGIEAPIWQTTIGNITYKEYITAFKDPDHPNNSVEQVVKGSFISPTQWNTNYYEGN